MDGKDFFEFEPEELDMETGGRKERKGRRRNAAIAAVIFILACALISGLVFLFSKVSSGPRAPKVVGMTYEGAKQKVTSLGLGIQIDPAQDSSGDCSSLKVESQDPKPGARLKKGEMIIVRLEGLLESEKIFDEDKTSEPKEDETQNVPQPAVPPSSPPGGASGGSGIRICLDPGHSSGQPSSDIDPQTGLDVRDSAGAPGEREAVWELAVKTKGLLEQAGYVVVLTKNGPDEYSSFRKRADIGNSCAIMVRLHYDENMHAILYPPARGYKKHGSNIVYVDPNVAASSKKLAEAMLPSLKKVGVTKISPDTSGTSNNTGPALTGSVLSLVPVVLIENDPRMVRNNPSGTDRVARAITEGIQAYFSSSR
ncbi:MAG: N-acetylmuramoyl-L-alanine amidase [Actinomycetota bacterium]|nr:N-acetylmuramoyl-L-alanine amidase [Actinomycetota bacterium]